MGGLSFGNYVGGLLNFKLSVVPGIFILTNNKLIELIHRNMKSQFLLVVVLAVCLCMPAQAQKTDVTPEGYTRIFNGVDLTGWRGRPGNGGVFSPYVEARFTAEERAAAQKEWNDDRDQHW